MAVGGIGNSGRIEYQEYQYQNGNNNVQKENQSAVDLGGDLYTPSTETNDIEKEIQDLENAMGVNQTNNVNSTTSTSNADVEDLKDDLDANEQRMEAIEKEIETLSDEAAAAIEEALEYQEAAVEEQKEETQKAIQEQIQAYVEANKNGDGMTREQLQANIASALPNSPNLSRALSEVLEANEQISEIDGLLGELKTLITDSANLQDEIKALESSGASSSSGNCKDPIGFIANGQEFNFFTDKDSDGALSQTNEFLGADKQWEEMKAADSDGNGTVTAEELEENNIFLAGMDGTVIKDAKGYKEAFGENFSIDINSYAEGGTHSAVDATADADNDGRLDQQLLGTFNVNVNGEAIQGYNTLDDVDWLESKYGLTTNDVAGGSEVATGEDGLLDTSKLGDLQAHGEFYNLAFKQNQLAKEKLAGVEEAIGFTGEDVDAYKEVEAIKGANKAQQFVDSIQITPRVRENTSTTGSNGTANIDGSYSLNGVQYNTIMDGSALEQLASQIQSGGNGNQWGYDDACLSFAYAYGAWIEGTSNSEMNGASSSSYLDADQYSEFSGTKEEVLAEVKNQLDQGKPVVLQVNGNTDGTSRHYVTVVGYNASAGDTLTEDDLIILDTYDGQIEGMGNNGARFMISGQDTGRDYDYQIYIKG